MRVPLWALAVGVASIAALVQCSTVSAISGTLYDRKFPTVCTRSVGGVSLYGNSIAYTCGDPGDTNVYIRNLS